MTRTGIPAMRLKLIVSVLLVLLLAFALMNIEKVIAAYYSYFSDFNVDFKGSRGTLPDVIIIKDLEVSSKDGKFSIFSDSAYFRILIGESIETKSLAIRCLLKDARFAIDNDDGEGASMDPVVGIPFKSGVRYHDLSFNLFLGHFFTKLTDIEGLSDGLSIKGSFELMKRSDDIKLNIDMVLSGELADSSLGDFKEMLLDKRDDGQYEASFTFEGNVEEQRFHVRSNKIEIKISSE